MNDNPQFVCSEKIEEAMATIVYQKVYCNKAPKTLSAASNEIKRLEKLLSLFLPQSEITAINARAGIDKTKISPETCRILEKSLEINGKSRKTFDICIGPLFSLWRLAFNNNKIPEQREIYKMIKLLDNSDLEIEKGFAFLKRRGQSIDLGGIGKGYIGDKVIELYKRKKVSSAFISLGGNVSLLGKRPDNSSWRVGIRTPDYKDRCVGFLFLNDCSVVTSGDYEKCIYINGKRYHHIIDPRTGYPADSGLRSVTIVSDSSVYADALATAIFVIGLEEGIKILKEYQAEAVFIDTKGNVLLTQKIKDVFQPLGDNKIAII